LTILNFIFEYLVPRQVVVMDSNLPGPSTSRETESPPRKQPKRSSKTALKKYLTEDDLERLLYDSDEDIDEWALLTKDDEASSEQEVEDEELEDRNLGEDDEGTADEQEESRQSPAPQTHLIEVAPKSKIIVEFHPCQSVHGLFAVRKKGKSILI
jgi:hypothetical protein